MNYIITGGTGFIGTHLANLIKEQDENARVWNLDIVDPEKLDGLHEETLIKQSYFLKAFHSEEHKTTLMIRYISFRLVVPKLQHIPIVHIFRHTLRQEPTEN